MPVGTATRNEAIMKKLLSPVPMPTVNRWCAHTSIPAKAMPSVEKAMAA